MVPAYNASGKSVSQDGDGGMLSHFFLLCHVGMFCFPAEVGENAAFVDSARHRGAKRMLFVAGIIQEIENFSITEQFVPNIPPCFSNCAEERFCPPETGQ